VTNNALPKRPWLSQSEPAGAGRDAIFFLLNIEGRNGANWIIRCSKALGPMAVPLACAATHCRLMAARVPRRLSHFWRTGLCSVSGTPNYSKVLSLARLVINHMRSLYMRLTAHLWSTAGLKAHPLSKTPFESPKTGLPSRARSKGY